mmetsp:Transcript_86441/g.239683  ORF Transcript_86441/g.239683 Transcript_86441/m.239683 type:complete len:210 (+) Transcript_86441:258-887(+)
MHSLQDSRRQRGKRSVVPDFLWRCRGVLHSRFTRSASNARPCARGRYGSPGRGAVRLRASRWRLGGWGPRRRQGEVGHPLLVFRRSRRRHRSRFLSGVLEAPNLGLDLAGTGPVLWLSREQPPHPPQERWGIGRIGLRWQPEARLDVGQGRIFEGVPPSQDGEVHTAQGEDVHLGPDRPAQVHVGQLWRTVHGRAAAVDELLGFEHRLP